MQPFIRSIAAILVIASFGSGLPRVGADERADVAAIVEAIGSQAVETDMVMGLSIGVAKGDMVLCAQGFGLANVELNVPATRDTVYRIGSITKQFTAAAILLLVEEGKIELDDPLTEHLPEYPEHADQVTIRHLLGHTSGIKDFTRLPKYRRELPIYVTPQDVLDRFQELPLNFAPGDEHRYCNSGYYLLGLVVENASGTSYQKFLDERIFGALGLKDTYDDSHGRLIPQRAAGYMRWGQSVRNAPYINMRQTIGAGNLVSTVDDLLAWQQALIANRLLSAESFQWMTEQGKLNDGKAFNYGLGVGLGKRGKHQVIRHGGGINGFRADLTFYPEAGYTIAVLANSENAKVSRISDRVGARLLDEDEADRPEQPVEAEPKDASEK